MTAKSDLLIDELVAASVAFGRGQLPDWQTRIEDAKRELRAYIDEVEGLEEDSGSYDSLIPDWANEPKQRWIPVGEMLPEDGEVVLFWDGYSMCMGYYLVYAGEFIDRDIPLRRIKPTHWMPLPTPPEGQG